MEIKQIFDKGILEISIYGDLDASSAIQLDEVMKNAMAENKNKIFIDCKQLHYISSAGLGVFISYLEDIKNNNGNFVFFNMSDKVFNVFQILGLDKILTIVKTKQEAAYFL